MADYRRMVSYMYQYENGVKRKNVGYARIESKGGQCKITLHMTLLGQLDSIFPTYLIHRDSKGMELIYLGDTLLRNQIMDSRLTADDTNIMNSGFGLVEMGGLLLFLNDKVFFASDWDDKPIIAEEVLEALRPKKKLELRDKSELYTKPKASKVPEYAKMPETYKEPEDYGDPVVNKESESQDRIQVANTGIYNEKSELSLEEELKIPKYKLPRGWKTVERLQKTSADIKNMELASAETESKAQSRLELSEEINTTTGQYSTKVDAELAGTLEGLVAGVEVLKEEEVLEEADLQQEDMDSVHAAAEKASGSYARKEREENNTSGSVSYVAYEADLPEHPTAQHFFTNYPRIYPFEDNEIQFCVKIEPKDIGLLPKDMWVFSNNSFLMHGFYCYHHLIFAKLKNRYGCQYILGIPGLYHNREQFMAKMFGFEDFKSIRKRDLKQGDFGYWYLPIAL